MRRHIKQKSKENNSDKRHVSVNGIEQLLAMNSKHSLEFTSPGVALERRRYRSEHPTEIAALKCMDGRVHLPVITATPLGIIQPFRNLGGVFNIGWPMFQEAMKTWVDYSVSRGRNSLVLVTYHFSRGDKHRGCKGFNYDVSASKKAAKDLENKLDKVFGKKVVYAVEIGVETDLEALILHGANGEVVDLADWVHKNSEEFSDLLQHLYPDMPEQIRRDLLPLVQGNIVHIKKVMAAKRLKVDTEHKEWVIAIGRGFDWLHALNTALIVGPFSPDLITPIKTAAAVIKENLDSGRIRGRRIVLMTSAPYRDVSGYEKNFAEEKALFLADFALQVIREHVPALLPHMQLLSARVDMNTRRLEIINREDKLV